MPKPRKFTRILKTTELIAAGVPVEAIPAYCCLADHANNENGLCWPKMQTLADILGLCVRTIQRHLQALSAAGVIEFVERRRVRGRFSSYLYRIVHYAYMSRSSKKPATTGHGRPPVSPSPNKERTRLSINKGKTDQKPLEKKRKEEAARRSEGFEWFFA